MFCQGKKRKKTKITTSQLYVSTNQADYMNYGHSPAILSYSVDL